MQAEMKQSKNEVMKTRKVRDWSRKSARPGTGDFAEYDRAARTGCRRNVGWALVEGLVGQDGEGYGFFGGGRDVQGGTWHRLDAGKQRGQLR